MSFSKVGSVLLKLHNKDATVDSLNSLYVVTVSQDTLKSQLGNQWSDDIVVRYYKREMLYLRVPSSSIASLIKLREKELVNAVNTKLEKRIVRGIRFV